MTLTIYTDGGVFHDYGIWGFIVLDPNQTAIIDQAVHVESLEGIGSVAFELKALNGALDYCLTHPMLSKHHCCIYTDSRPSVLIYAEDLVKQWQQQHWKNTHNVLVKNRALIEIFDKKCQQILALGTVLEIKYIQSKTGWNSIIHQLLAET